MEAQNLMQACLRNVAHKMTRKATHLILTFIAVQVSFSAIGQSLNVTLNKVSFQDKILERVLRDYVNESKAKVVAVYIERYDGDYTYTLRDLGLFDTVKRNPTSEFGEWENCVLLFYSGIDAVVNPLDTTAINKIQRYIRPLLPDQFSEKKTYKDGIVEDTAIMFDPTIWRFKVRAAKILWLRKVQDYQLEKIPYIK